MIMSVISKRVLSAVGIRKKNIQMIELEKKKKKLLDLGGQQLSL